jgi:hypothetical protein
MILTNGTKKEGIWENGKIINWIDSEIKDDLNFDTT